MMVITRIQEINPNSCGWILSGASH